MTDVATDTAAKATDHLRAAGGQAAEAVRSTGHAARIAAEQAHGHVKAGLTGASDAIKAKGLAPAAREGAKEFWKSRPLATIGLAVGGTIVAAHVVSHAFSGPRQQKAANRDMSRGGPNV
ncbi:MAG: hypothetical protein ACKVOE_08480 [Rickettsiales bacterium]